MACVELALAAYVVLADLLIPAFVLVVLAAISLAARRERPATLGFHGCLRPGGMALVVVALTTAWTVLQIGLVLPVLNHVTGQRQDLNGFRDVEGHLGTFLAFVALSWTLAAVVEETAFRGYLQVRITDVVGRSSMGVVAAVALSSALFGLAHTEQGVIGVAATTLDAVFFSLLRLRFGDSLWAPVLAHGFNNTLGLTTFFLVGPIYGLW